MQLEQRQQGCSKYMWVIYIFTAYYGATYVRCLMVYKYRSYRYINIGRWGLKTTCQGMTCVKFKSPKDYIMIASD